jgi:glycine betaine/proline transport system permease protein
MAEPSRGQVADRQTLLVWLLVLACVLILALLQPRLPELKAFPAAWTLPVTDWLNIGMDGFVAVFKPVFRALSALMEYPLQWFSDFLGWLPWSVGMVVAVMIGHRAGGWPLAAFTAGSLAYILLMGLWPDTMNSLALVAVSVPMAVALGFGLGVWGLHSARVERFLTPLMDITQTIPAFAYLLPILILFGFGPVVGLIAGIIFAFPPMVKNTIVGLREVPSDIIESGLMSGATRGQLFFLVRCRAGLRQILLGVNQTTMAALNMIIVASIIGGSEDIGWRVLSTLRKAEFGESLVAGIVIALMAMVLDRITYGLATRVPDMSPPQGFVGRHRFGVTVTGSAVLVYLATLVLPELKTWPEVWTFDPAGPLNTAIEAFVLWAKPFLDSIKNFIIFTLVLPLKIGLLNVVGPFTWGFTATIWHAAGYAVLVAFGAWLALGRGRSGLAIAIASFGVIMFFGLTNLTWPGASLLLIWFGYRSGGVRLALWATAAMAFMLLTGSYEKAVLSVQLCALAVAASFLIGTGLGIAAAESDRFSRILRPINDTLQTMPVFVLLIPVIMIFKIGEFSALLAIILYAVVAPIRYAEYGLRNVSKDAIEASTSMGATRSQILWRVKMPLAMPNIMLGLNQAIMFGISMLVITALVGTDELGQIIYIGLSKGNFGIGFLAGVAMAVIALLADQYCRAWQRRIDAKLEGVSL